MTCIPVNAAMPLLLDGDILSYRAGRCLADPLGRAIAVAGRGRECHTGIYAADNGHGVAIGMRFARQKLKLLVDEVIDNPGDIDVYRFTGYSRYTGPYPLHAPPYLKKAERRAIVNTVRGFALHDQYGWLSVLKTSVYFVPGLRWFAQPHYPAVDSYQRPPHCSQAVHYAYRKHGHPLLLNRSDRTILPADIVTSPLLTKLCTLENPVSAPRPIEHYYADAATPPRLATWTTDH
jgi:hypothetical protein